MKNVTLIASPQRILQASDQFNKESNKVNNIVSEMCDVVRSLSSVWEGNASMTYLSKCKSLEKDINTINRMIREHTRDLQDIARAYISAEQSNEESASGLTSGVIC